MNIWVFEGDDGFATLTCPHFRLAVSCPDTRQEAILVAFGSKEESGNAGGWKLQLCHFIPLFSHYMPLHPTVLCYPQKNGLGTRFFEQLFENNLKSRKYGLYYENDSGNESRGACLGLIVS